MIKLIEDLSIEWLGSITEEIAKSLVSYSLKNNAEISKHLLTKYNLINLKDDFETLYKYSYIKYSLESGDTGLGELFSLKSVVRLFNIFFYKGKIQTEEFNVKLIEELTVNAFRKESLTRLYYSRKSVNFYEETNKFCEVFHEAINKCKTPSEVLKDRKINSILNKINSITEINSKALSTHLSNLYKFKNEYFIGLRNKIEKINFYGIELPTVNRPREIDLLLIFEEPDFRKNKDNWENYNFNTRVKGFYGSGHSYLLSTIERSRMISFSYHSFLPYGTIDYFHVDDLKRPEKRKKIKKIIADKNINPLEENEIAKPLLIREIFKENNKIVFLGNPGAGKSSLFKYITLQILNDNSEKIGLEEANKYIPFIVPIKDYNKYKTSLNGSILQFIQDYTESKYQVIIKDIELMKDILNNEKSIVFFDGLDEIFDIEERQDVKNDIEIFANKYINSIIVVSSRYESYNEVFLDPENFVVFDVNQFDDKKIQNFVTNWFMVDQEENPEHIEKFILSLQKISFELKSNPLLLTLILLIYKYEKDLPSSKLDIYESCTRTLVERRDEKEKKLGISEKIRSKLSLLSVLAYWQYRVLSKQSNDILSHSNVKAVLIKYLMDRKIIEDFEEAENNVEIFLEFAKNRSIYFENNFTHKTFLEYLTAYYIYANFQLKGKIEERNNILIENISNSYWYIVIELFIFKVDRESLDSEIIDNLLLTLLRSKEEDSLKILLPMISSIKNININIKKEIIKRSFLNCIIIERSSKYENYILFDHLISIIKKDELFNLIIEVLEEMAPMNENNGLIVVILELFYSTGKPQESLIIKQYLEKNKNYSQQAWILYHKHLLENDWTSYFELMKKFFETFKNTDRFQVYHSVFNKPVFFASNKFNWIFSSLFSKDDEKIFHKNIHILNKLGITTEQIYKNLRIEQFDDRLSIDTKFQLALDPYIQKLILKTIPYKFAKKKKDNVPFYSKFYTDKTKKF